MIGTIGSAVSKAGRIFARGQIRKSSHNNQQRLPFDHTNVNKVTLGFVLMMTTGTLSPYLIVFFQLSKNK